MKSKPTFKHFLFVLTFIPYISFSQSYIGANDLQDVNTIISEIDKSELSSKFPLNTIKGKTYVSFVAKTKAGFSPEYLERKGCIVHTTINHPVYYDRVFKRRSIVF